MCVYMYHASVCARLYTQSTHTQNKIVAPAVGGQNRHPLCADRADGKCYRTSRGGRGHVCVPLHAAERDAARAAELS